MFPGETPPLLLHLCDPILQDKVLVVSLCVLCGCQECHLLSRCVELGSSRCRGSLVKVLLLLGCLISLREKDLVLLLKKVIFKDLCWIMR